MNKAADGKPVVGSGTCMLGARIPDDIEPDKDGNVHPFAEGMSVTPDDPAHLPLHLRPASLGGKGRRPIFQIERLRLGASLVYRPDPRNPGRHGFVEPSEVVPLSDYQEALARTRQAWIEVKT